MTETFRDRAKHKTIATIRSVAWELFLSHGYDKTTTREIAARAGVAVGTVFLHAHDKEQLLRSLLEERFIAALNSGRIVAATSSESLLDRLLSLVSPLVDECSTMPGLASHFFRAFSDETNPESVEQQLIRSWSTLLANAQESGETRSDLDIETFTLNLLALFRFHLRRWLHSAQASGNFDTSVFMNTLRKSFNVSREGIRPRVKKQAGATHSIAPPTASTAPPATIVGRKSLAPPRLPPDLTMLAKGYRR